MVSFLASKYEGFHGFPVDVILIQLWNHLKIGTPNLMDGQNLPHQNCRFHLRGKSPHFQTHLMQLLWLQ